MGTRADFYLGEGSAAEWLGSVAWDGYDVTEADDGLAHTLRLSPTKEEFLTNLKAYFAARDDVTLPDQGWPWPWNNSHTTDRAYAFVEGEGVLCFGWGRPLDPANPDNELPEAEFPDMTKKQNITYGPRSGLIIIGG